MSNLSPRMFGPIYVFFITLALLIVIGVFSSVRSIGSSGGDSSGGGSTRSDSPGALDHGGGASEEAIWVNGALVPPLPEDPDRRAAAIALARNGAAPIVEKGSRYYPDRLQVVHPIAVAALSTLARPSEPVRTISPDLRFLPARQPIPDRFHPGPRELMEVRHEMSNFGIPAARTMPTTPSLLKDFFGLDYTGMDPPSPDIAAGPRHVIEVVNARWRTTDKCGLPRQDGSFSDRLGSYPSDYYFDPKVIFDAWDGHWLMAICGFRVVTEESFIYLLVSESNDPLGRWWYYPLGFNLPSESWSSSPDLSTDPDAIYITSNQWSFSTGNFQGSNIRVLKKTEVYLEQPATQALFGGMTNPGDGTLVHTLRAAKMYDYGGTFWLLNSKPGGGDFMTLWGITGPPTAPVLTGYNVPVGTYDDPPDAVQPNAQLIDTGDARLSNAVYQANRIWTMKTARVNWGGPADYASIQITRINTLTKSVINELGYGTSGLYLFGAGFDFDAWPENRAIACFSQCGASTYLEARYVEWTESSTWGTHMPLHVGEANYAHSGSPPWRWGNYCAVDRDLMDNKTLWMAAPYASNDPLPSWDTHVGATAFESADLPVVTPAGPFVSTGIEGSPMVPVLFEYTLENPGPIALYWELTGLDSWQNASQYSGVLAPGETKVVDITLDPIVQTFAPGEYVDEYYFEDCTAYSMATRRTVLTVGSEDACPGTQFALIPNVSPVPASLDPDEYGLFVTAIRDMHVCAIAIKADLVLPQTITGRIYRANGTTRGSLLASGVHTAVTPGDGYHYIPVHCTLEACQEYDIAVEIGAVIGCENFYDTEAPFDCHGTIRVRDAEIAGNPASTVMPHIAIIGETECANIADLAAGEVEPDICSDSGGERGIFITANRSFTICAIGWEADFSTTPVELGASIYEVNGATRGPLIATGIGLTTDTGMRMHRIPISATLVEGRDYDIAVSFPAGSWTCVAEDDAALPYTNGTPFRVFDSEQAGNPANAFVPHFTVEWSFAPKEISYSLAKPDEGYPPPHVSFQAHQDYGIFVESLVDQELYALAWRAAVPAGAVIGARVYQRSGNIRTALLSEGSIYSASPNMRYHGIPVAASLVAGGEYDFEIDITDVAEWNYWLDTGLPYEPYGLLRVVDGEQGGDPSNLALIDMRFTACNDLATTAGREPTTPPAFHLSAPSPNPISERAMFVYSLDRAGPVTVTLFDVKGRRVATLLGSSERPAGAGRFEFDLRNIAAGVYFLKLESGGKSASRKITIIH